MKRISTLTTVTTFTSTIIGFGLIALTAYFIISGLQNHHLDNEKAHALEISKKAIVLPLWNYDETYINEVLGSFIDEELDTVIAVKITTLDDVHQYGRISKNFSTSTFNELASMPHVEVLKDKINYRGRDLGTIEVYFSTAHFSQTFQRIGAFIVFMTFLMALLLAYTMNYYLRRWILNPLNEIATESKKTQEGNFNLNFKTNYVGELNVVTEAFNDTLSALVKRDKLLNEQKSKLEVLVERRTRELDQERLKSFQASRLASLGEMAGAIAHEINNPLTIIHCHSINLKNSLIEMNAHDLARKSAKIHETSERIAKIVRGLRSFARDGAKDPIQPCQVEKFVEDLSSLCLSRATEKSIKLSFIYNPQDVIVINITQLGQVIINLINNAMDAIEDQDEKWITVEILGQQDLTKMTVTDSGKGISEEIIPKMMDPFFTTKDFGKGTGLGLSISQRIVTHHGGEFYYNLQSKNTQFVINIPQSGNLH